MSLSVILSSPYQALTELVLNYCECQSNKKKPANKVLYNKQDTGGDDLQCSSQQAALNCIGQ